MDYRLLALDLDGTLLQSDGSVHPLDLAAIARVQEAGVEVTIITGRLYSGSSVTARTVGIGGPIVCADGSQITAVTGDRLLHAALLAGSGAEFVRKRIAGRRLARFLFVGDQVVYDSLGEPFLSYVRTWSPHIERAADVATHSAWADPDGVLAVVMVGPREEIHALASEIDQPGVARGFSFDLKHQKGIAGAIIRAPGVDKGTGLTWMTEHYGIALSECVAVGDWLNDVPMLRLAGRSYCARGSMAEVCDVADELTRSSRDGEPAVAQAIERAFGL